MTSANSSTTAAGPGPSVLTQAQRRPLALDILTFLVILALSLYVLRWALLRGLRVLLRDRVRVQALGSRGLRGLQIRSPRYTVRVQRIFFSFNGAANVQEGCAARAEQRGRQARAKEPVAQAAEHARPKAWFTLHVRGVGLQLAKPAPGKGKHGASKAAAPRHSQTSADSGFPPGSHAGAHHGHGPRPPPPPSRWASGLRSYVILLLRPALYVTASASPLLARVMDVQIERAEVYIEGERAAPAEGGSASDGSASAGAPKGGIVLRVADVHLGLQVTLRSRTAKHAKEAAQRSEAQGAPPPLRARPPHLRGRSVSSQRHAQASSLNGSLCGHGADDDSRRPSLDDAPASAPAPPSSAPMRRTGSESANTSVDVPGTLQPAAQATARPLSTLLHELRGRVGSGARGVGLFLASGLPETKVQLRAEIAGVAAFRCPGGGRLSENNDGAHDDSQEQAWTVTCPVSPTATGGEAEGKHSASWEEAWTAWAEREAAASGSFWFTAVTTWAASAAASASTRRSRRSMGAAAEPAAERSEKQLEASCASASPRAIAPRERILFAPHNTTAEVDVLLGPNFFHLKAHRAFSARTAVSEVVLGGDALLAVRGGGVKGHADGERSNVHGDASKRDRAARAVIAATGSLGVKLERVRCVFALPPQAQSASVSTTSKRPVSGYVEAAIQDVHLGFSSAQPHNPLCKHWLDTITPSAPAHSDVVASSRLSSAPGSPAMPPSLALPPRVASPPPRAASPRALAAALHERMRRPMSPVLLQRSSSKHRGPRSASLRKDVRLEPRRIFHVDIAVAGVFVDVHTTGRKALRAVAVNRIQLDALSTWTPFGICPSIRYSLCAPPEVATVLSAGASPNEAAVYVNASMRSVELSMSSALMHLQSASDLVPHRKPSETLKAPAEAKGSPMRLPKMHVGFHLGEISAKADLADAGAAASPTSLILKIPGIDAAAHTEYHDAHVVRTDAARRAAWKAYDRNQLEWSREGGNSLGLAHAPSASAVPVSSSRSDEGHGAKDARASRPSTATSQSKSAALEGSSSPNFTYSFAGHLHVANSEVSLQSDRLSTSLFKVRSVQLLSSGSIDAPTDPQAVLPPTGIAKSSATNVRVDGVKVSVQGPEVWAGLERLAAGLGHNRARRSDAPGTPAHAPKGLLDKLPSDASALLSVTDLEVSLATIDKRRDEHSLGGIRLVSRCLAVDYAYRQRSARVLPPNVRWGARGHLELSEDAPLMAAALAVSAGRAVVGKVDIQDLRLIAIDPDAIRPIRAQRKQAFEGSFAETGAAHGKGHCLFRLPESKIRVRIRPDAADSAVEHVIVTGEHPRAMMVAIELANTYQLMLVAACAKRVLEAAPKRPKSVHAPAAAERRKLEIDVEFQRVEIPVSLPEGVHIFVGLKRLQVKHSPTLLASVGFESLAGAVLRKNVVIKGERHEEWSHVADVRGMTIRLEAQPSSRLPDVHASGDSLVLNVPFDYRMHEIIEGTSVAVKATKQLAHEVLLGREGSAIDPPTPSSPKALPNISLQLRVLVLEAEDDPVETQLGLIWRLGRDEARARLERQSAFAQKMSEAHQTRRRRRANLSSSTANVNGYTSASSVESDDEDDEDLVHAELVADATQRLRAFDSGSWVRRINQARASQESREEAISRRIIGRFSRRPTERGWPINVKKRPSVAPLFRSAMADVHFHIRQPDYGVDGARDFINAHGDPIPEGLDFSIFIPMNLEWRMTEWRINVRDYPVPMLHVAPEKLELPKQPSLLLTTDLCIAEQMGGPESTRRIPACLIHEGCPEDCDGKYIIQVPKVAMPTKIFGDPRVKVGTPRPLRMCWGQSIQPAIADIVRVFDGFTKIPPDPSPKIGIWDKIPLILHGTLRFDFVDDGALHLYMKGSRDPYEIGGNAAGWVKCWKQNVSVRVGESNKENEVLQIFSDEYALAIPDLSLRLYEVSHHGLGGHDDIGASTSSSSSTSSHTMVEEERRDAHFQKVVAHLRGGVRWGAGIIGERTCDKFDCVQRPKCTGDAFHRKCRFWDRVSHWQVVTKTQEYFDSLPESKRRDSYAGWRHEHIHFSLSVRSASDHSDEPAQNSLHITPLTSAHFWSWVHLFSSAMSLPIRQGSAFPDSPPKSPKFGFHMATIKYRMDLSPMTISHVYIQHAPEKYRNATALHLGLKARADRFNMDVHQRQQEMIVQRKAIGDTKKVLHKPINEAEVAITKFELRAICAEMHDENAGKESAFNEGESPTDAFLDKNSPNDASVEWFDKEDFVEIGGARGGVVTGGRRWEARRMRAAKVLECPQFNFHRKKRSRPQGQSEDKEDNDSDKTALSVLGDTKFGDEDSHDCSIGMAGPSNLVQSALVRDRMEKLAQEAKAEGKTPESPEYKPKFSLLRSYAHLLQSLDSKDTHDSTDRRRSTHHPYTNASGFWFSQEQWQTEMREMQAEWLQFHNRYLIHSPVMFLSDGTRDILLKYYLSNRSRRGHVHSMTAKALRSIRELNLGTLASTASDDSSSFSSEDTRTSTESFTEDRGINLLRSLLKDTMQYINTERSLTKADPESAFISIPMLSDPHDGIRDDFEVRKANICILVKPQIVLRSELDDSSCVIVSAMRTRLMNYTVRDTGVIEDDVNEKVMNRNFFSFDKVKCWHPRDPVPTSRQLTLPVEVLLSEERLDDAFRQIMPRTDCVVQYDKFNKLRLNDSSRDCTQDAPLPMTQDHLRHHMDLVRIQCPRFSVHADPDQYAALYNVVTDLLLYRDPAYREHAKRLETTLFAYNFRDPEGLARMVDALQRRIRQAEELHHQYERHYCDLNATGKEDDAAAYAQLIALRNELSLLMEAISVAQDRRSGSDTDKKSALRVEASAEDIAWYMNAADSTETLAELSIKGASFTWLNKADNSTANTLSIVDLHAENKRPDALFSSIISKYTKVQDHFMVKQGRILNAAWSVLAPVGGIAIIDRFELNVHPLRVQIEIEVGREIMHYIFGSRRDRDKKRLPDKPAADESPKLRTSSSQTNLRAEADRGRAKSQGKSSTSRAPSPRADRNDRDKNVGPVTDESHVIAFKHAAEMRKRAAANKTFVYVKVPQTVFCLSYKGDKGKSLTDLYDLVFRAPSFEYRNRTWAYEDLANSFKKDVLRAAWSQKTTLIKGFLTARPRRISAKLALRERIRRQRKHKSGAGEDIAEGEDGEEGGDDDDVSSFISRDEDTSDRASLASRSEVASLADAASLDSLASLDTRASPASERASARTSTSSPASSSPKKARRGLPSLRRKHAPTPASVA